MQICSGAAFYRRNGSNVGALMENQYLYICSDEEIKNGDWMIHKHHLNKVKRAKSVLINGWVDWLKVIASTDPKLKLDRKGSCEYISHDCSYQRLPKPSQQFIELFCKLDGKGEFEVEYEVNANGCNSYPDHHPLDPIEHTCDEEECQNGDECPKLGLHPKINQDNTINIREMNNIEEYKKDLKEVIVLARPFIESLVNLSKKYEDIEPEDALELSESDSELKALLDEMESIDSLLD